MQRPPPELPSIERASEGRGQPNRKAQFRLPLHAYKARPSAATFGQRLHHADKTWEVRGPSSRAAPAWHCLRTMPRLARLPLALQGRDSLLYNRQGASSRFAQANCTTLAKARFRGAAQAGPNPSVEARPNGKPPGPRGREAYHVPRGPGALPSVPPHLKR